MAINTNPINSNPLMDYITSSNINKIIHLFLICLLIKIINGYFFIYLNDNYFHYVQDVSIDNLPRFAQFFIAIIIAPLIETLILQVIPNKTLRLLKISNLVILILIPSILFAAAHTYHNLYVAMAFFSGIVLNYFYIESQKISKHPFLLTALLHALYNLYGFLFVS